MNGSPPFRRTTATPAPAVVDEQLVHLLLRQAVARDALGAGRRRGRARPRRAGRRRAPRSVRTSSSARTVTSPGSPGPAPTIATLTRAPPRRAPGSSRAAPRSVGSSRLAHGRSAARRSASAACSGRISSADVAADALRERRRRTAGRDADDDRIAADDRRQDEAAELRVVGDVAERRAFGGRARDVDVDDAVVRRGDHEEASDDVGAAKRPALDPNGETAQIVVDAGATTVTFASQSSSP